MNETTTEQTHTVPPVAETPVATPTPAYNGWLVSNDLVKRSIAVFLHSLLGQLIIALPLLIVFYIMSFVIVGISL